MTPTEPETPPPGEPEPGPVSVARPSYRWYHKLGAVAFICLCLDLGLFLLYFPWSEWWDGNLLGGMVPEWHRWWEKGGSSSSAQ